MIDSVDITEKRLALVVVDVQNKFADASEGLGVSMRSKIPRINEAIEMFRSAGAPVIFVYFDGDSHETSGSGYDPDALMDGISS